MTHTEYMRVWRAANREKARANVRASLKRYRQKYPDKDRLYAQSSQGKKVRAAANARYRRRNSGLFAGYCAKRRTARLNATPAWADMAAIQRFYADRPAGQHVDHVLPLRGTHVSGLHVLENLQYLPAIENSKKGNSHAY